MNTQTQEALKMAIEALPELISTAQCEFDSQHKAYEGYPAMYHRYGYLKDIANDGTKAFEACKEALAQPQPRLFLDLSNSNGNHPVQQTHPALSCDKVSRLEVIDNNGRSYVNRGVDKIEFSYQDDGRTLKIFTNGSGAKPSWQGLSDDEVDDFMFQSCDAENGYSITDLIRLVEQALKEKNT